VKKDPRAIMRYRLLEQWGQIVYRNATGGALTGAAIRIQRVESIPGPRAGALEFLCGGLDAGTLLAALTRNDCAAVAQMCPWDFDGQPQAYLHGRYVRCEAGWGKDLAQTSIRLADVCKKPQSDGRWVAGISETGCTIVPQLCDRTSNFLVSGATGAGKSVALRNMAAQFAQDPENTLVLCDGKMGESLRVVERLPGVVGPCAIEVDEVRAALAWACIEMRRRYAENVKDGRIIVMVDEFQELVADPAIVAMLRKLTAQGRAARVHTVMATQHPTVTAFGDSATRRNLTGKVALKVEDPDASRVAVGGATPRADHLLGCGDSYVIGAGASHRAQGAFVDSSDIARVIEGANGRARWQFAQWPAYEPETIGQDLPEGGTSKALDWSGTELAAALLSAFEGEGRPAMCQRAAALGANVGDTRGRRLIEVGRDLCEVLRTHGYALAQTV